MREISSRTLTLLLLIAIVVSIGGTIISINRLNQLIPRITGLASDTTAGVVNVTLASVISITIVDSQIDFGSCTPNGSLGANLSSNISNGTTWQSWGAPGVCTDFNSPDNITVKNDGNTNVNLSVKTNVLASTFIQGDYPYPPQFLFSVRNASDYPGCNNQTGMVSPTGFDGTKGMQWDWKNFSKEDTNYLACANLTPTTDYHTIYVFAKIDIPSNAPQATETNATLTFTATNW